MESQDARPLEVAVGYEPELADPGVYEAELKHVEVRNTPYGERARWIFGLVGPVASDGSPLEVSGWSGTRFSSQANAGKWWKAIAGTPLAKGEEARVQTIIGKHCMLTLDLDDNEEWNRIVAVAPLARLTAVPARVTAQQLARVVGQVPPEELEEYLRWRAAQSAPLPPVPAGEPA